MANYLIYPTKIMNITQNYSNSYSHAPHSQGSPADYPIDEACGDGGRDYFYCPCDEMKIAHIYGVNNNRKTNTIWLESTSKVDMPYGSDYVTILVTHPEDDDLGKLKEGQTFKRGAKMFREGKDGNATGYHFHIAVGTGKFTGSGWVQNSKGSWVNKTTGVQLKPEQAFYVDKTFTTIKNANGINFKNLPATVTQTTPKELYRVRKNWADPTTQIGAYSDLNNAKAQCDKMGSGYYVFNSKGEAVYPITPTFKPYLVKITAIALRIRKGPGTQYNTNGFVYLGQSFTIIEEKNGFGKLKSGAGWISLQYTKKV